MNLLIESILDAVYPPLCPCCGAVMVRGERPMCLDCRLKLPLTGDELSPTANHLIDKLQSLTPLERAAAYFTYRRQSPQAMLLQEAKYNGRPSINRLLAREFARKLQSAGFFDGVDAIAAVPLNFWRLCKRGYNQSHAIAQGLADVCSLPIVDAMRARRHASQTTKSADRRRADVEGIYSARAEALDGVGHLLVVDDICTTGSTLHQCLSALHAARPAMKLSVVVLASTSRL